MIDFAEKHVEFILEFRPVLFPINGFNWVVDVKKGLNSLFVYCPLVEPRMVGDAQVPLLRIVPVEGRDGEMITRVFDPIQYCPLLQRRFHATQSETYSPAGNIACLNPNLDCNKGLMMT
jgi:hypothetical protein